MVEQIRLPSLGQTSDEMSIVVWYKKVGDPIKIGEPLLCVETDKAQVDVESAEEGIVLKIVAEPGESLSTGALLAYVGALGEIVPEDASAPILGAPSTPVAAPVVVTAPVVAAASETSLPTVSLPTVTAPAGRVQALPVVRNLAASLGVDLSTLTGTGPGGRIERADVEAAARYGTTAEPTTTDSTTADSTTVSAIRRAIARRLTRSIQTIPQFTVDAKLDARLARDTLSSGGVPGLTYTHLLLRAIARAAREHPAMLRVWSEEGPSYRVLDAADVGLAVAGDDSLYIVRIAEPDRLPLADLVSRVRAAAERARDGVLSAEDQLPVALSVSNLGMFDVESFRAIVDPDQTAIVAVGAVQDCVVARDGKAFVIPQVSVSVSCDHRSVDGVQAAKFLQSLKRHFETDSS